MSHHELHAQSHLRASGKIKTLLIVWILLGFALSNVSVSLAALNPGTQSVAMCIGGKLVTLLLDQDGNPVEPQESRQTHCVFCELEPEHAIRVDYSLAFSKPLSLVATASPEDRVYHERARLSRQSQGPP